MSCILCWLRGSVTARGHYVINGMSICSWASHIEAAVKTLTPEEAIDYLNRTEL
jgi:hypothetical protein